MLTKRFFLAVAFSAIMGLMSSNVAAQCIGGGSETFSNLGSSSSSYATRTWTGNNGVAWSATDARTDQDLTGDAIALRTSTLKNTSTVTGGVGTLSFNYKRVFTGNSTLKVYVNGVQYGGDITVSADTTTPFSQVVNVAGNVVIEIKNSLNRTIVDDVTWTCYETPVSGPELQLADASNVNQACGALNINFGAQPMLTNTDAVFTIKNTGTSALNVSALNLSNAIDFTVVSPSAPFSVAASGSQIVLVRFNSAGSGHKTSVLTIANNDSNEASCTVNLEGTALAPCVVPTVDAAELAITNILATSADVAITGATADRYLAVLTNGAALSANPTNGVNYTVGMTLGGGMVVYNGLAASFSLSGLTESTDYAVYIFPYNSVDCTEGPLYYTETSIGTDFATPVAPCLGGSETFSNLGSNSSTYATRTWTGDNSIAWSATDARTDQDLTGDAIALRTGILKNTTAVSGGIGTLHFNYKRVFTGDSTLKVFVNGIQYGSDITVTSDLTTAHTQTIDVSGPVTVELRNSGNRVIIDDLAWDCYQTPERPEIQLLDNTSALKACGNFTIALGEVAVNTDVDSTFTIENKGTEDLEISALTLSDAVNYTIVSPTAPFTVTALSTQVVTVRFNSATAGNTPSTLTIESNDADEASCVINFTATALEACVAPDMSLASITTDNITATSADVAITGATADGYIAVISSTGSSTAPVNGTVYLVGDTLGAGTVAYVGAAATFTLSGLTSATNYAVNVYAYNNTACIGGPAYVEGALETEVTTEEAPCIGGGETFSNLGSNASSYATRTWTGDNGVSWSATDARTDQDLTGDAIAVRTGTITNTTVVSGGIGTLTFNYKRVFTGNSTMKVFVNGIQYGGDITVSADTTTLFSQAINVTGNVTVEIRNSVNRIIVDDISWNCYAGTGKMAPTTTADFKVYPNPSHGQFQLDWPGNEKRAVEVYNFSGNLILSKTVLGDEMIDLGNAPKGIYLLKVKSAEMVSDRKIVIE
ncbi:choice-of-anchor D domain-containing protein [Flavobacterium sp.]|uniref:choice-of-anchor D domain-containing protein n=1 Tax=Flavobacterium sp. TaxID=239 RepID=UPI0039E6186B